MKQEQLDWELDQLDLATYLNYEEILLKNEELRQQLRKYTKSDSD